MCISFKEKYTKDVLFTHFVLHVRLVIIIAIASYIQYTRLNNADFRKCSCE